MVGDNLIFAASGAYIEEDNVVLTIQSDVMFHNPTSIAVFDGRPRGSQKYNEYAFNLSEITKRNVLNNNAQDCKKALSNAVWNLKMKGNCATCVAGIFKNEVNIVNVGDSGLIIIRDGKPIFKTTREREPFNKFKTSRGRESLNVLKSVSFCTRNTCNYLKDKRLFVQEGDIIVMGTDGLWDNMFATNVVEAVKLGRIADRQSNPVLYEEEARNVLKDICRDICCFAYEESISRKNKTPFSIERECKFGSRHTGGRKDDISVVACMVVGRNQRMGGK